MAQPRMSGVHASPLLTQSCQRVLADSPGIVVLLQIGTQKGCVTDTVELNLAGLLKGLTDHLRRQLRLRSRSGGSTRYTSNRLETLAFRGTWVMRHVELD